MERRKGNRKTRSPHQRAKTNHKEHVPKSGTSNGCSCVGTATQSHPTSDTLPSQVPREARLRTTPRRNPTGGRVHLQGRTFPPPIQTGNGARQIDKEIQRETQSPVRLRKRRTSAPARPSADSDLGVTSNRPGHFPLSLAPPSRLNRPSLLFLFTKCIYSVLRLKPLR